MKVRLVSAVLSLAVATSPITISDTAHAAALAVPAIIGDHMVLQRGTPAPILGTATAGTTVTVKFQNQTVSTSAGADGVWRANLASMAASTSPPTLTITSGSETLAFTDVQVGEVWVVSGRSNMEYSLSAAEG